MAWHDWFQGACALGTCVFLVLTIRSQNRMKKMLDEMEDDTHE